MASPEYWLLTVPNRGDAVEVTLNKMARGTAAARAEAPQNPHRVDVPNLVVGTLDSLMALRSVRPSVLLVGVGCRAVHSSFHLIDLMVWFVIRPKIDAATTWPRWTSRSRRW